MEIDQETVKRIAALARIEIGEDQRASMATQLSGILDWIDQLDEVDTSEVEPVYSVIEIASAWRSDEVTDGEIVEDVLSNAPKTHQSHFVVPKVVE
jgi:aspartyl-tRNA(Asn)/glutamyl-tRNA(Gln) amidotransferase subunit C